MSRNFGLKAHEIKDEVWRLPSAYAVFGIAFLAIIAVVMLGG